MQTKVQNGLGLNFRQSKLGHQAFACIVYRCTGANQSDYSIQVVDGNEQSFQDVGALFCLGQFVLGPSNHNFVAVSHKMADHVLQIQHLRTAVHQGDVVYTEAALQRRVLV